MTSLQARNVNHPGYQENLREEKYTVFRGAILAIQAGENGDAGLSLPQLEEKVRAYLSSQAVPMESFPKPGSVHWYTKTVQLDLEARNVIQRMPNQAPIRLRKVT